jgi:hypothetical protein
MEAKGPIKKTCTDAKWSDDARGCITKATTRDVLKDCTHDKLTGEQNEKLREAARPLDVSDVAEAMAKMREFEGKMCQCKTAPCAEAVSEEMTRWSQEMATQDRDPPKMSEEDMKTATEIGQRMGDCMAKAMGAADATPPVEAPEQQPGDTPHEGDVVNGRVISK